MTIIYNNFYLPLNKMILTENNIGEIDDHNIPKEAPLKIIHIKNLNCTFNDSTNLLVSPCNYKSNTKNDLFSSNKTYLPKNKKAHSSFRLNNSLNSKICTDQCQERISKNMDSKLLKLALKIKEKKVAEIRKINLINNISSQYETINNNINISSKKIQIIKSLFSKIEQSRKLNHEIIDNMINYKECVENKINNLKEMNLDLEEQFTGLEIQKEISQQTLNSLTEEIDQRKHMVFECNKNIERDNYNLSQEIDNLKDQLRKRSLIQNNRISLIKSKSLLFNCLIEKECLNSTKNIIAQDISKILNNKFN